MSLGCTTRPLLPVLGSLGRARSSLCSVLVSGAQSRACPGLIVSWWAAPFTVAGASWVASQGTLPPLGAPPRPPLHGPARWAPARGAPGTLWGAGSLLDAHWDSGHTSGLRIDTHKTERRTPNTTNWSAPASPPPGPQPGDWMDECPAPTPEINLPLDVTDASGATSVPTLFPILRSGRGRGDWAGVPETGFHGTGQARTP